MTSLINDPCVVIVWLQATKLNGLVKKYSQAGVVFGSYPCWVNNYYKVRLTVEASSPEVLDQVEKDVNEEFSVLKSFDRFPAVNPMEKIRKFLAESQTGLSCLISVKLTQKSWNMTNSK